MMNLFCVFACEYGMSSRGLEEVSQGPGPGPFLSVLISQTLVLFGCLVGRGPWGPACPPPGAPGEGDVHTGACPRWHGDLLHLRAGPHHPEGRGLHGAQVGAPPSPHMDGDTRTTTTHTHTHTHTHTCTLVFRYEAVMHESCWPSWHLLTRVMVGTPYWTRELFLWEVIHRALSWPFTVFTAHFFLYLGVNMSLSCVSVCIFMVWFQTFHDGIINLDKVCWQSMNIYNCGQYHIQW